jgi:hypothetical protein
MRAVGGGWRLGLSLGQHWTGGGSGKQERDKGSFQHKSPRGPTISPVAP